MRQIHLFLLGIACLLSVAILCVLRSFNYAQLSSFGPTAQIYFNGIKSGFMYATTLLTISFIVGFLLRKKFNIIDDQLKNHWDQFSNTKRNLSILVICFMFAFMSHAGNIINGYFNMDDLVITGTNHSTPFLKAVLTPYANDHMIPLYRTEMKVMDVLFGQNPIPYNMLMYILFALIPYFTYLIFKKLGIGLWGFGVFLIIFTGATAWSDMLTGFYIMNMYPQVILFFSVTLWAYLSWLETHEKKYLVYFSLAGLAAILINISGIWTIPVVFLFMIYESWVKNSLNKFVGENLYPIICLAGVSFVFAVCFYISFHVIQPNTFLTTLGAEGSANQTSIDDKEKNWKPLPLAQNFISFFTNGVSLSLVAPNTSKILAHPAVKAKVLPLWPYLGILVLTCNILFFYFVWKNGSQKHRKLILWLATGMFITIFMVILARPNHEIIPDFDYRYVGVPFYFYCIFLAVSSSLFINIEGKKVLKIIIPAVIIIFAAQQVFSFHSTRLAKEAELRKESITHLNKTLLNELNVLSDEYPGVVIPNLSGSHISDKMPGFTLSNYVLFFDKKMSLKLIQNDAMPPESGNHMVETVSSLRASTSPKFKQMLLESNSIRSYYMDPSEMIYETLPSQNMTDINNFSKEDIVIRNGVFDPEKLHTLEFTLITNDISGNMEIELYFVNDFKLNSITGKIRIDDYTNYSLKDGKRIYHIKTDLLQLFPFALSNKIANPIISVPNTKNAFINEIKLF